MGSGIISIFSNSESGSVKIKRQLRMKLKDAGFVPSGGYDPEAELVICIGGDGALLNTLRLLDFPDVPVVGVNTGHLGFFQELQPSELDEFVFRYKERRYVVHCLKTAGAEIVHGDDAKTSLIGLNEIVIRGAASRVAHLDIFIGDSFIEAFRGDGVLVSTPSGSTAYNYALGGSIVDPRLDLLQVTPIAPINNSAYRSFTSSVLLPPHLELNVFPEQGADKSVLIAADGAEGVYVGVKRIHIGFSGKAVKLIRFENYDFWNKAKQKLL
ncbi:MAG: NAD(+)/NADH kinase [Clostridiales Family XIII bacterium]|jgi:NAD+ kinase|nr:NAD(+)/NADH kinase [Clostridiales Family XIII bacterium]